MTFPGILGDGFSVYRVAKNVPQGAFLEAHPGDRFEELVAMGFRAIPDSDTGEGFLTIRRFGTPFPIFQNS
jgi:hypothetical protein